MCQRQDILEHLDRHYDQPIRDPLWKHIYFSSAMMKLVSHPVFQRLNGLKQLGSAVLLYPGATHTRFNHSLGVFHVAKRIIRTLCNSDKLPNYITLEGVKSFLSASLLHDIGHFPHAHSFVGYDLKEHEQLSGEYVINTSLKAILEKDVGCSAVMVQSIIDLDIPLQSQKENEKQITFFRHLLSGSLDPDKLDYLNRDAFFCGVPYGLQDVDFIISQMQPIATGDSGFSLPPSGIMIIEHLLFSKYLMYKTVYWHKTVSISTALVRKAIRLDLQRKKIDAAHLYQMTDADFYNYYENHEDKDIVELIHESQNPWNYTTVVDQEFDENISSHRRIEDVKYRDELSMRLQQVLHEKLHLPLSDCAVFIDVAPAMSFEFDINIRDDDKEANLVLAKEKNSVFNDDIVQKFTQVLRRIRFIVKRKIVELDSDTRKKIIEIIAAQMNINRED